MYPISAVVAWQGQYSQRGVFKTAIIIHVHCSVRLNFQLQWVFIPVRDKSSTALYTAYTVYTV